MSRLQCRGSIVYVAFVLALFTSRAADAQVVVVPGPRQPLHMPNPWVTGAYYDIGDKKLAEHHLRKLQAKLQRNGDRGDSASVDRDLRRIQELKFRITVDEWLIRKNLNQDPGYYPLRIDETSLSAITDMRRPAEAPAFTQTVLSSGPTAPAPMITITIVNAEPTGAGVAFAIDGVAHQADSGSRQDLAAATGSYITYDGGGSLGQRRYLISPGVYEFRSTAEGWALYKLTDMP